MPPSVAPQLPGQPCPSDADLERAVHAARLEGSTWAAIAALTSTSRSYAHRRWCHLDGLVLVVTCPTTGAAVSGRQARGAVVAVGAAA